MFATRTCPSSRSPPSTRSHHLPDAYSGCSDSNPSGRCAYCRRMTARQYVFPQAGDDLAAIAQRELPDLDDALRLFASLTAAHLPGVVEAVPAARTVLVKFDPLTTTADELGTRLAFLPAARGAAASGRLVTIAVLYDGDDLAEVAELLGLSESEVIDRHTAATYRVAFGGFAPGFAYLVGGDPRLQVPRHPQRRTTVPAGSGALAGEFSGLYPRSSPGGWQLIGRTEVTLWDLHRDPPAVLRPGMRVRFRNVGGPP